MCNRLLQGLLSSLLAATAAAQIVAVPPALYRPGPAVKAETVTSLLTPESAPRRTIELLAPTSTERAGLKSATVGTADVGQRSGGAGGKGRPLQVGFARSLPDGGRPLWLAGLPWQTVADGGLAARIEVHSPGAAAIRLGVALGETHPDVTVRFVGSARPQQVFGPYPGNKIAEAEVYWSPVLEGETGTLEIYLPPGISPASVELSLPRISHLVVAGADLRQLNSKILNIGDAGSCEIDVACVAPSQALTSQAHTVAKMIFTVGGNTYACTGTLLNDSLTTFTPYFFTASHCMDSQNAAATLNTYWFFAAVTCGSKAVPPYVLIAGGAMLLGRSVDYDWALVRLNHSPPVGTTFSAWRAEDIPTGAIASVLHHPEADLEKFTQGSTRGDTQFVDGSSFITMGYSQGSTEAGSSGAGLLTFNGQGGYYELRGGLFGSPEVGGASCANPAGIDYYSRLDIALPLLTQYLTPNAANPSQKTVVVEFYNASLDDYFITTNPDEINGLDMGAIIGWQRTGLRFLAYADPSVAPADASPVCRFYVLPQAGDSHFYSADPNECAQTAARFSGQWFYESPAVFYIQLPDKITGACPANTRPVYRFLKTAKPIHHRYTTEVDVRNCLYYGNNPNVIEDMNCSFQPGDWLQEGYGTSPNAPVMCSPTG